MTRFVLATCLPLPLLLAALVLGGVWGWIALAWLTLGVALMDRLLPEEWDNADPGQDFTAGSALSVGLALAHIGLVLLAIALLCGPRGVAGWSVLPCLLALATWTGQVTHPNAHELIHRPRRALRCLGRLLYGTMLFGHHASSHPKVHHIHVATPDDPNTARRGEGYWRYFPRAWIGSFRAGLAAERRDLTRAGRARWRTPYLGDLAVALTLCLLALLSGGATGLLLYLGLCLLFQNQVLLSDYVQHYGLERRQLATGRYEPTGLRHSWNAPQAASQAMMLNAPRHSDHHLHAQRLYPGLQLARETMPILPRSLPVMATLALWPGGWRRVMDPHLADWRRAGGAEPGRASPPG
ncbi:alkane 1-monooxygenase [Pseudooceanicola algae]|uniref:Alkane 1-monooxygenase 2 n=1 Tax=Pseudooceanicola algae TaxID=1537215 RepID=A0A418SEZ7_9RHOB|nr:alkane 1-monooxygenase [Pseudooceanicola algae]QPM89035.1 Alkane 1-monooxygenase 2 [Pseudooceanicola algae]